MLKSLFLTCFIALICLPVHSQVQFELVQQFQVPDGYTAMNVQLCQIDDTEKLLMYSRSSDSTSIHVDIATTCGEITGSWDISDLPAGNYVRCNCFDCNEVKRFALVDIEVNAQLSLHLNVVDEQGNVLDSTTMYQLTNNGYNYIHSGRLSSIKCDTDTWAIVLVTNEKVETHQEFSEHERIRDYLYIYHYTNDSLAQHIKASHVGSEASWSMNNPTSITAAGAYKYYWFDYDTGGGELRWYIKHINLSDLSITTLFEDYDPMCQSELALLSQNHYHQNSNHVYTYLCSYPAVHDIIQFNSQGTPLWTSEQSEMTENSCCMGGYCIRSANNIDCILSFYTPLYGGDVRCELRNWEYGDSLGNYETPFTSSFAVFLTEDCSSIVAESVTNGWKLWHIVATVSENNTDVPPAEKQTLSAYPNPFNPETTIRFELTQASPVTLEVFNIRGQRVDTLLHEPLPASQHSVVWRAGGLGSGVYLARLRTAEGTTTARLLLLK